MGRLVEGRWLTDDDVARVRTDGEFKRTPSVVRHWVTADGSAGPTGEAGFAAAAGRYHLYAAFNCPWAHRALLLRALKGLEDIVPVSYVAPRRSDQGWVFWPDDPRFTDGLFGHASLHQVYAAGLADYTGRVTVPLLFDTHTGRLVSNESADIVRMFNSAFNDVGANDRDFSPAELLGDIDELNARIYATVNNGVYRAGFARTQQAYDAAVGPLFETLDLLDERLASRRYLFGDRTTEADWRLFPTLARFDVAYHYAFKCNRRRLIDYPNLWPYARDLYQTPGVAETVHLDIYKAGYFSPSEARNPHGIVPLGPRVDFDEPHGRGPAAAPVSPPPRATD